MYLLPPLALPRGLTATTHLRSLVPTSNRCSAYVRALLFHSCVGSSETGLTIVWVVSYDGGGGGGEPQKLGCRETDGSEGGVFPA